MKCCFGKGLGQRNFYCIWVFFFLKKFGSLHTELNNKGIEMNETKKKKAYRKANVKEPQTWKYLLKLLSKQFRLNVETKHSLSKELPRLLVWGNIFFSVDILRITITPTTGTRKINKLSKFRWTYPRITYKTDFDVTQFCTESKVQEY